MQITSNDPPEIVTHADPLSPHRYRRYVRDHHLPTPGELAEDCNRLDQRQA
jgi:hypothetical protein